MGQKAGMRVDMKNYYHTFIVIVFGIIAFFGLFSILLPEKGYSENENRYLKQFPKVQAKNVLSGDYQEQFEKSFSDQFLGRDAWMKGATTVKRAAGFQEVSGVYFGKSGHYITKTVQEDIDQKRYLRNLRYVEYLGETCGGAASTILVPSPGTVLRDKIPNHAPYYNADEMYHEAGIVLKKAKNVDVRSEIKEYAKQNQVYYKTDHHWTLLGAYAAYSAYCDANQMVKHTYGYFAAKKISEDFLGTTYSKIMPLNAQKDTMYAATNVPPATVVYDGMERSGIYDVEKLTQKDKYGYFFGGNYGEVSITMNEKAEKKLLVIKDSYANSFVPFLMESFDQITMIDLRYYKKSVQKLLEENNYGQVLVLYELSNFAQDTNLYKLVY